jgi:hypothetical protein
LQNLDPRGRRLGAVLALMAAIALVVTGAAAVKWYVWDIAIAEAGEPDRSMLFWESRCCSSAAAPSRPACC